MSQRTRRIDTLAFATGKLVFSTRSSLDMYAADPCWCFFLAKVGLEWYWESSGNGNVAALRKVWDLYCVHSLCIKSVYMYGQFEVYCSV